MCTRCVETIRYFEYIILLVIFAVMGVSTAPDNITYTCGQQGVVLADSRVDLNHIAIATGTSSGSSLVYCKPNNVELEPCKTKENNNSLTMFYEDKTITNEIMGGNLTFKFYKLVCSDTGFTATHTSTVFIAKGENTIIPEIENLKHDFNLQLTKGNVGVDRSTDIKIGDPLKLLMTGIDVVITPLSCTAYPEGGYSSSKVTIWTASEGQKQCFNKESDIVDTGSWSITDAKKPDIEIKLFAFRFEKKPEVVIECTAKVCSKTNNGTCTQECVTPFPSPTTVKRKRRGIESGGKDVSERLRSSSVSFAVRDNEALDNSSPGLSVGFTQLVAFGLILLFLS